MFIFKIPTCPIPSDLLSDSKCISGGRVQKAVSANRIACLEKDFFHIERYRTVKQMSIVKRILALRIV